MNSHPLSRRAFLRQSACAAVGTTALANVVWSLRGISSAVAQTAGEDYKALVCLFLYGGNDANNLLVPKDTSDYNAYASARQDLALGQSALLPLNTPAGYRQRTGDNRDWGLHPACADTPAAGANPAVPGLRSLFNSGKLACVANVGTLVYPVTRADWINGVPKFPAQLFSHNDQQVQWETALSDGSTARTGWGGRMADRMAELLTGTYGANGFGSISMSVSLAGTNTFQVGNTVSEYQVSPYGVVDLDGYGGSTKTTIDNLLNLPHQNLFEAEFAKITQRSLTNNALLKTALNSVTLNTVFPSNSYLSDQLKMVAKLIAARGSLGMKRQVFFVAVGGYDTHGDQLSAHASLINELSGSLGAFYQATVEKGVADKVTTFTASDFGRTFPVNSGAGSDHGWGSHHLVLGGAVRGGDLYGKFPTLSIDGPDDTGQGRWIPTTSVDEYSATLAKWFGVDSANMGRVFPNLGHFNHPDLGFMT